MADDGWIDVPAPGAAPATGRFDTALPAEQETAFQGWIKGARREGDLEDYDMRGWWAANGQPVDAPKGHFPDTFKKPNHPTFSDESKYHGVEGNLGGHWGTDAQGRDTFTPGATNLRTHGEGGLKEYFTRQEPGAVLLDSGGVSIRGNDSIGGGASDDPITRTVPEVPAAQGGWVDVPTRGQPDTPSAAPATAESGWVDVGPAAKPAGQPPEQAAEASEGPNFWERTGIARPGSPVAEHGLRHELLDIPRKIGRWWTEGQDIDRQAAADDAAAGGDVSRLLNDRTEAQRARDWNMAGGLVAGGIPARTGLPLARAGAAIPQGVTTSAASAAAQEFGRTVARPVADTLETIFSPTTKGPGAAKAEASIREEVGARSRATEIARDQMSEFDALVNSKTPAEQRDLVRYVEGRSAGAAPPTDPALQPVADTLKRIYEERRDQLEKMSSTAKATFIEDYYNHMWQPGPKTGPAPVENLGATGTAQGSGRNLKERTIPTLEDGINKGLVPIHENPLEATLAYVTNMDRFIAHNKIFDKAVADKTIHFFPPGGAPDGWVKLKGRLGEKPGAIADAYAPEDFARVYNNFISRGWAEIGPTAGKVYDKLRAITNGITFAELGLSGFHATTMVNEGIVSEFSKALGQAGRGELSPAAKTAFNSVFPLGVEQGRLLGTAAQRAQGGDLGGAAMAGGKALIPEMTRRLIDRGLQVEAHYLDRANLGPEMAKVVDLATKANMRVVPSRSVDYRASAAGSFWDSWKRGTLGNETRAAVQDISQRPVLGTVTQVAKTWGRAMDTVAQPLFDKMIPRLKNGAFYEEMRDWLGAHPAANDAEQAAAARRIADSIDNRFGEMNLDNIFWNKMLKQSLQLGVRAVGWDLGTVREIAGGGIDMARGGTGRQALRELSPRAKYTIALPIVAGLLAQVMAYLKTGAPSPDPFVYPTGGENPDGTPEKAIVPGYMKDVLGYLHSPVDEVTGKLATAPRTAWQLMTNRDFRDLPIAEMSQWARENGAPPPVVAYIEHVAKTLEPISVKSYLQRKEGTNISVPERLLGMAPAPTHLQEPDELEEWMERARRAVDKRKERSDRRIEGRLKQ